MKRHLEKWTWLTDTIIEKDIPRLYYLNFVSFHPVGLKKRLSKISNFQSIRRFGCHLE